MKAIAVVLAEDHLIVREGLRALLNSEPDIEVVGEADTGRMAVELTRKLSPAVVVMDIAMPGLNGLEATHEIRRMEQAKGQARVAIVALTANSLLDERAQCLAAGMDEHLAKPFGPDDIRAVLERVLLQRAVHVS